LFCISTFSSINISPAKDTDRTSSPNLENSNPFPPILLPERIIAPFFIVTFSYIVTPASIITSSSIIILYSPIFAFSEMYAFSEILFSLLVK